MLIVTLFLFCTFFFLYRNQSPSPGHPSQRQPGRVTILGCPWQLSWLQRSPSPFLSRDVSSTLKPQVRVLLPQSWLWHSLSTGYFPASWAICRLWDHLSWNVRCSLRMVWAAVRLTGPPSACTCAALVRELWDLSGRWAACFQACTCGCLGAPPAPCRSTCFVCLWPRRAVSCRGAGKGRVAVVFTALSWTQMGINLGLIKWRSSRD